ncbi:MAG: hypothetical protein EAX96_10320 [Candidatus Lokiarchaeota archaeon]|nr:hypothetical protein [Candidatus Lokiarchaeota archaeon]
MRPPKCAICGDEDFDLNIGGLIYFKKRQKDIDWEKRMNETGGVGHPPYAEWFCPKHIQKAKEVEHLTINDAFRKLRDIFKT